MKFETRHPSHLRQESHRTSAGWKAYGVSQTPCPCVLWQAENGSESTPYLLSPITERLLSVGLLLKRGLSLPSE